MKFYSLAILSIFAFLYSCSAQSHRLGIGETPAPFTLTDQNGHAFHSSDYLGKKIMVIYFYQKMKVLFAQKKRVHSETATQHLSAPVLLWRESILPRY